MGKSLSATTKIHNLAKNITHSKRARFGGGDKSRKMEGSSSIGQNSTNNGGGSSSSAAVRLPLSEVLVGQMYYNGYGIPTDAQKGRAWMTRASRTRSSVWKVSEKRPGYNASDSDSDETKAE
ncbi:hypothetical protein M5689_009674 [Euphorbia peplus]|nr:hypothetical protein M5689_009674 [Euphorbia peplus]